HGHLLGVLHLDLLPLFDAICLGHLLPPVVVMAGMAGLGDCELALWGASACNAPARSGCRSTRDGSCLAERTGTAPYRSHRLKQPCAASAPCARSSSSRLA